MFKSIYRGCNCAQCSYGSRKKDKQLQHRKFRMIHKQKVKQEDYEIKRSPGYHWA
jgi:hypothetical protein